MKDDPQFEEALRAPHPEPAKCEDCNGKGGYDNGLEAFVCGSCHGTGQAPPPPEPAPEIGPLMVRMRAAEVNDLRAQLAAARERGDLFQKELQAATERADKAERRCVHGRLEAHYWEHTEGNTTSGGMCAGSPAAQDIRREALEDAVRVVLATPGGTEIHVEAIRALAKEPKP